MKKAKYLMITLANAHINQVLAEPGTGEDVRRKTPVSQPTEPATLPSVTHPTSPATDRVKFASEESFSDAGTERVLFGVYHKFCFFFLYQKLVISSPCVSCLPCLRVGVLLTRLLMQ